MEGLAGKPPVIACMVPTFENNSGIEIIASIKDFYGTNSIDYEWLTTVESLTDAVTAIALWENIFTTYPELNTIFCVSSEAGYTAAQVMKERGLTSEDVTIIAISDLDQTLDYIRSNQIYATMSENIPRVGYQPAEWICTFARTGEKPEKVEWDTGTFAITKENVESYKTIENDRKLWK